MDIIVKLPDKDYSVMLTKIMLDCRGCEIIELPKGHGRLGDLDALETEMVNGIHAGNCEEGYEKFTHINNRDDCVDCVRFADTIIEANKESEVKE